MPNPWDAGSARVLASLGFEAFATTSSGFAATLGRLDGSVTRDEAIAHGAASPRRPTCRQRRPRERFRRRPRRRRGDDRARGRGRPRRLLRSRTTPAASSTRADLATARVAAAAEAAHGGDVRLVLTARAENHIRGNPDLADTIARLQAFQEAGADVLYAPGLRTSTTSARSSPRSTDR